MRRRDRFRIFNGFRKIVSKESEEGALNFFLMLLGAVSLAVVAEKAAEANGCVHYLKSWEGLKEEYDTWLHNKWNNWIQWNDWGDWCDWSDWGDSD